MRLTTMIDVQNDLAFVKEQAAYHRRQASRFSKDETRSNRHKQIVARFENLQYKLEKIEAGNAPVDSSAVSLPKRGVMRLGNLDDLPADLRKELSISESDQLELDIQQVIRDYGGAANIDEILVSLWRATDKVHERVFISRKLYRMAKAEMIFSVPKRKGMYAIAPVDPNDVDGFDADEDEEN
ncbi:MAG: hypothetical protein AAFX09_11040 [Pseudomonadota bacterium]